MTREEAQDWLRKLYARADITDEYGDMEDMQPYEEAINMAISALSDSKGEPTDEEIIEYCNKRGYVICTQAFLTDYLKREQRGIRFEGYVGINGVEFARLLERKGGE